MRIIVILRHRKRTYVDSEVHLNTLGLHGCMPDCLRSRMARHRATRHRLGEAHFLTSMFGVLLGSESAKAVDELPTHRWAAWTAACVSGIGSATWLSRSPWSFT
ncbi:hypothetical protein [Streptomyces sp. AM 3-1-1]|uniref:hypothetical protein n=1 Tax=Streptomyces sp. AM 3-1-1 TaxID=3028711 RepID=UPI0023B99741|nr:hypothetical protein [Streptomyces sp. AM 3-1-1]WEH30988.1 hypothetical protein P0D76_28690 [Streptomyces sp. AM 3-1-1]